MRARFDLARRACAALLAGLLVFDFPYVAIARQGNAGKTLCLMLAQLDEGGIGLGSDDDTVEELVALGIGDDDDTPGTDTPGTDTPGTDTPGTDTPGTDTPGTDTPGTDTPGTDTPGSDTPGTDTPGTDTPGTDTPGTDTPGTDTPGSDTPGTDTPGTDTPGGDEPGTDTPGDDTDDSAITGEWGEVTWSIKDGVLTIKPTNGESGTLDEPATGDTTFPWCAYFTVSDDVTPPTKVVVESGVKAGTSIKGMFKDSAFSEGIDLSGLDTSATTDMSELFQGAAFDSAACALTLDTSNATDMSHMFDGAGGASVDLSGINTSKLEDASYLFANARFRSYKWFRQWTSLKSIDHMFSGSGLVSASFQASRAVADMDGLFENCASLTSVDISGYDNSGSTTVGLFDGCAKLEKVVVGAKWDTSLDGAWPTASAERWWSFNDQTWYTNEQIVSERANIADSYTTTRVVDSITIYRMYNTKTSEHLYTKAKAEYESCGTGAYADWRAEGVAWQAPRTSDKPVYRLYNKKSGDHLYTTSESEKAALLALGDWRDEDVAFYSALRDQEGSVPLYRLYNNRLKRGQHHYTKSENERNTLVANYGWSDERIGFYGIK